MIASFPIPITNKTQTFSLLFWLSIRFLHYQLVRSTAAAVKRWRTLWSPSPLWRRNACHDMYMLTKWEFCKRDWTEVNWSKPSMKENRTKGGFPALVCGGAATAWRWSLIGGVSVAEVSQFCDKQTTGQSWKDVLFEVENIVFLETRYKLSSWLCIQVSLNQIKTP